MSQKIIGIDLGAYSVKVLYLERRLQEYQILDYVEHAYNLHSRLSHEEMVAAELEQIFAAHSRDADVVSMSFPGQFLSSRVIELPFTNTKKLNQIVEFEIEGYVPFPLEDLFFDYHVLDQTENQSRLLCVYMHKAKFKKYMENLENIQVDAKYFGADFIDLAGIAQIAMVPHQGLYALCDIGHSKTNFLIMDGKQLKYARTIGIGGYHFTRVIQRAFNLNQEKAEAMKLSRGKLFVREDDSDQIARILNRVAKELVTSIKQTILGAANIYGNISIPAVYCCGGGSKMSGMPDYLSFHLRTNVFELEALNFVNHQFEETEEINKIIPQVLSTALRSIYSNKLPKINFRKGEFAFKQDIEFITREFKSAAVLFVVILVMGICYYFYADYHYSERMAAVDKQVEKVLDSEYKEIGLKTGRGRTGKPLKQYLKTATAKLSEIKTEGVFAANPGKNVVAMMQDLSEALPPKKDLSFEITEFNFSDDFLRLDARTDDPLNVEKVLTALNQSEKFGLVEADDPQAKPGNRWDFVLKVNVK